MPPSASSTPGNHPTTGRCPCQYDTSVTRSFPPTRGSSLSRQSSMSSRTRSSLSPSATSPSRHSRSPTKNSHYSRLFHHPPAQVPIPYEMDGPLLPRSRSRNSPNPIHCEQWSTRVSRLSSRQSTQRLWRRRRCVFHIRARRCLFRNGPQRLQGRPLGQERPAFVIFPGSHLTPHPILQPPKLPWLLHGPAEEFRRMGLGNRHHSDLWRISRTEADGRSSITVETWREQNLLIRAQYDTPIDVLPVMAITAVVEPRCLPA